MTNNTFHSRLVHRKVRVPEDRASGWSFRTAMGRLHAHLAGMEAQRQVEAVWTPACISQARPPEVSWLWPSYSGTRFSLGSPSGWENSRTRPSPRWRDTASGGISSPATEAARWWTVSEVCGCSCVCVRDKVEGWDYLLEKNTSHVKKSISTRTSRNLENIQSITVSYLHYITFEQYYVKDLLYA